MPNSKPTEPRYQQGFVTIDDESRMTDQYKHLLDNLSNVLFNKDGTWLIGAGKTSTSKWLSFEFDNSVGYNTLIIHHPASVPEWHDNEIADRKNDLHVELIGKVLDNTNEIVDIGFKGTLQAYYERGPMHIDYSKLDGLMAAFLKHPRIAGIWMTSPHILTNYSVGLLVEESPDKLDNVGAIGVCVFPIPTDPEKSVLLVDITKPHMPEELTLENHNKCGLNISFNRIRVTATPAGFGTMMNDALHHYHDKLIASHQGQDLTYVGIQDYLDIYGSKDPEIDPSFDLGEFFADVRDIPTDLKTAEAEMDII